MLAALQHHGRRAQHHLGGVGHRLPPGQAHLYAAVGQGLDEGVDEGGAAARHRRKGVHLPLVDALHPPGGGQKGLHPGQILLRRARLGAQGQHPLSDGGGGVGHDPQEGRPPLRSRQPAPQGLTGQAGGDGHHRLPLPQGGGQLGEHPLHHLGLDAQKDIFRLGGRRPVVLGYGAPQLRRQGLRFGPGAVGDNHLLRPHGPARRLNQRRAHVSRSDKCRFFHPAPPFRIVCNQCFLFRPPVLFDGRLPPEGRPLVGALLPVDHRQRPPAPGILGPPPSAVGRQTPLHIGGGAGVEGSVPAAEDINPPAHGLTTPAAARATAPAPGTPPPRRPRTRRCPVPSGWPWRAAGCPRTGG